MSYIFIKITLTFFFSLVYLSCKKLNIKKKKEEILIQVKLTNQNQPKSFVSTSSFLEYPDVFRVTSLQMGKHHNFPRASNILNKYQGTHLEKAC